MANRALSSDLQGRHLCSWKQDQRGVSVPAVNAKLLFNMWSQENVQ